MRDKFLYIVIGLLAFGLIIDGSLRLRPNTKTQKVLVSQPLTIPVVRNYLLRQGVANAWITNFGGAGKADCFATSILNDGKSIFEYCKLQKVGLVP